MSTIYLAGGCFWGIQAYFDLLAGVIESKVGYANSSIKNPSYEMVCAGKTNAREALELCFDEQVLGLAEILRRFFDIIDPTSLDRQGNDIGSQYASGIYALRQDILDSAMAYKKSITTKYSKPIVTEIAMLTNFYPAESYHQKYLAKNPFGYCHIDISKALKPC